jgi:hypothetical protein
MAYSETSWPAIAPVVDPKTFIIVNESFRPTGNIEDLFTAVRQASNKDYQSALLNTTTNLSRNTQISIFEIANKMLFTKRIVLFNRIHVNDLGIIKLPKGNSNDVLGLLVAINTLKGLNIKPTDIINNPLPTADAQGYVTIDLQFTQGNSQYYSGPTTPVADSSFN